MGKRIVQFLSVASCWYHAEETCILSVMAGGRSGSEVLNVWWISPLCSRQCKKKILFFSQIVTMKVCHCERLLPFVSITLIYINNSFHKVIFSNFQQFVVLQSNLNWNLKKHSTKMFLLLLSLYCFVKLVRLLLLLTQAPEQQKWKKATFINCLKLIRIMS